MIFAAEAKRTPPGTDWPPTFVSRYVPPPGASFAQAAASSPSDNTQRLNNIFLRRAMHIGGSLGEDTARSATVYDWTSASSLGGSRAKEC